MGELGGVLLRLTTVHARVRVRMVSHRLVLEVVRRRALVRQCLVMPRVVVGGVRRRMLRRLRLLGEYCHGPMVRVGRRQRRG